MKARGLVSIVAGLVLVLLPAGTWFFIAHLVATGALTLPSDAVAPFLGRLYLGLALIILCGLFAVGNGVWIVRRGGPNRALTISTAILFLAAMSFVYQATKVIQTS